MIDRFLNRLERALMILSGVLLGVMVFSVTWQVILRYGFKNANAWSEELARYSMVLIVMLTAPIGLRRGKHVRVDYFVEKFPKPVQKVIDVLMDILMFAYMVGLLVSSYMLISNPSKQYSPGLGIQMSTMYMAVALGSVLMMIFMLDTVYKKYIAPLRQQNGDKEGSS